MKSINKKLAFNQKMGRQNFYSGGLVKRKHFASAGSVTGSALSDAGTGAAIGSVIPGVGTAVGAVAGGVVGLLSGLFGGSGPQQPNIVDPVTGQQITDANGNVVATQQQLQSFSNNLQGVNGVQNQQAVLSQLQGVANGTGPNPAQAALNQTTGQNINSQAALMAGQRGAASNVGLQARQIGQQGAQIQQTAVGQGATMQANQELNALNSEGTIAGQQVGETQNALTAANNAANTNQSTLLGAQSNYNSNVTGGQASVNTANTPINTAAVTQGQSLTNGLLSGSGANKVNSSTPSASTPSAGTAAGYGVNTTASNPNAANGDYASLSKGGSVKRIEGPHKSSVANFLAMGGKSKAVPAMVSPGEVYLSPDKVRQVVEDGANPMKVGEKFKGKAKVKGDSRKNDIIPRTLEDGGMVIPRHITTHKMSAEKAELFVHRELAKRK